MPPNPHNKTPNVAIAMRKSSARPEVRGTAKLYGGTYPPICQLPRQSLLTADGNGQILIDWRGRP